MSGSHISCSQECQRVWGNEPSHSQWTPCWELESQWTLESLERNFRGQKPLAWRVFYIIGKLMKRRCLKWVRIANLDIWNTSYGQKKGRESNWQFDSWPLKVRNRHDFLVCRRHETYRSKALDKGYNFALDRITIGGLHVNLCPPKVAVVPTVGISGLPLGSPRKKSHLDVAHMQWCRVYYKGKGGGFHQVWAVVNLVNPSCPWFTLAPKMFQLCTNHIVLVLCRFVWVIEVCQFFLIPSRSSSTPFYPRSVMN